MAGEPPPPSPRPRAGPTAEPSSPHAGRAPPVAVGHHGRLLSPSPRDSPHRRHLLRSRPIPACCASSRAPTNLLQPSSSIAPMALTKEGVVLLQLSLPGHGRPAVGCPRTTTPAAGLGLGGRLPGPVPSVLGLGMLMDSFSIGFLARLIREFLHLSTTRGRAEAPAVGSRGEERGGCCAGSCGPRRAGARPPRRSAAPERALHHAAPGLLLFLRRAGARPPPRRAGAPSACCWSAAAQPFTHARLEGGRQAYPVDDCPGEPSWSVSLLGRACPWSAHQDYRQERKDCWCLQEAISCFTKIPA